MNLFIICGFSNSEILMLQAIIAGAIVAPATPRLIGLYKKFKGRKKNYDKIRRY